MAVPLSMDKLSLLLLALSAAFLSQDLAAQSRSPLDQYLESGETIVIARCLKVGPVSILMRANIDVEVLFVVKGKETLRRVTVDSQYEMEPGRTYLLRTEYEARLDDRYFKIDSRDSVIPISPAEDIAKLKLLPSRIIVLRTMNIRVDELDVEIRSRTYELEALKAARADH
jgi:hypothetical protein